MSVWKRPDGIYQYDFQLERRRYTGPTGEREKRAALTVEQRAREAAREALRKQKVASGEAGPITVEMACARFWTEVADHYSGNWRQTVWGALGWLQAELGPATLLRDIGSNRIALAISKRRGCGVSNTTVNRTVVELLRTILRRAGRVWEQETQAHKIEWQRLLLKEPQERVRELQAEEEIKLLAKMRPDYLPPIRLAVLAGLRLKELADLRWPAIDWQNGTVSVVGKGDRMRVIPLTPGMAAILAPLRGHDEKHVFTYAAAKSDPAKGIIKGRRYPLTYSGLSSAWRRFGAKAAGIPDFRFHDTRHTAATRLLRNTGNLRLAQRLLGHREI